MKNYEKWGYVDNKWFVKYDKTNRWVNNFKEECELTSLEILDNADGNDLCLLFSGGTYSTAVAKSLINMDVPFKSLTCKYKDNSNKKEFEDSMLFCNKNNIEQTIVELDIDDFMKNEYSLFLDKVGYMSPLQASHCWLFDKCEGFPIMGNGFLWIYFDLNKRNIDIVEREYWYYIERWKKYRNKDGATQFFKYNAEIVFSQILEFLKIIDNMIRINNEKKIAKEKGYNFKVQNSSWGLRDMVFYKNFNIRATKHSNVLPSFKKYYKPFPNNKEMIMDIFKIADEIVYPSQVKVLNDIKNSITRN